MRESEGRGVAPETSRVYRRVTPRGGSIFAGTVTTHLEIVGPGEARKRNTWRDKGGTVERRQDCGIIRSAYNLTPDALARDGYSEVACACDPRTGIFQHDANGCEGLR